MGGEGKKWRVVCTEAALNFRSGDSCMISSISFTNSSIPGSALPGGRAMADDAYLVRVEVDSVVGPDAGTGCGERQASRVAWRVSRVSVSDPCVPTYLK